MKLDDLIGDLDVLQCHGNRDTHISGIAIHSGAAAAGSLFIAIPGTCSDGHTYLPDAYAAGSRAFVAERPFIRPDAVTIVVADARRALAGLAATFYRHPSRQLALVGITGTNGKTTTAFLLESILAAAGHTAGLLSTIQYRFGGHTCPAERTTPDALHLQQTLRAMVDAGVTHAVMEMSSHGLEQSRAYCTQFDVGVFTNLSPEHLDYHGDMQRYFASKQRLFTQILPQSDKPGVTAIINADCPWGATLLRSTPVPAISYGLQRADVRARDIALSLQGLTATIESPAGDIPVHSRLIGRFNLCNVMAAVAAAVSLGIPREAICAGIERMQAVPGRMEAIGNACGISVFVDYAHTADALENVLRTLRDAGAARITTVFGCGGDRDRKKRPDMGRTAAQYSRLVILTSDNPRSEDPAAIIADIETGVRTEGFVREHDVPEHIVDAQQRYLICPDRREAIRIAVRGTRPGDSVLIAGKGHETCQIAGTDRRHFDDREEARLALAACAADCTT